VPYELSAPSITSLTVRVSGGSSTLNGVQVQLLNPGLFDMVDTSGRRYAIIMKSDGSFASPENPIIHNETVTIFGTGLGQTNPTTYTNRLGPPNQSVVAPVIVGIASAGIAGPITAVLSSSMVGVYEISFPITGDIASGQNKSLSIGVDGADGRRYYSNGVTIPGIQ